MKKITFPHMGEMKIPVKAFFQELGFEVVVPPPNSKKTLDLGVKYCPEFACLPLKLNMGNFIEALDDGAELIIMGGGCGPCRFGYYAEVHRALLEEMGYDFEMIVLEPNLLENYMNIKNLIGHIPWSKIIGAGKLAWNKVKIMDEIHRLHLEVRAGVNDRKKADKIYKTFLRRLDNASQVNEIKMLGKEYKNRLINLGQSQEDLILKVGLVGEIYLVIEPFVNLNIEKNWEI